MSTYAIGDVHGCFATLEKLLATISFDPARDRVWLVGDLVNRGPHSLNVLRWAAGLGANAKVVLGNHDLHLVGRALGARKAKRFDRFDEVLAAPDRDDLIDWLRQRPLLHAADSYTMVHAGLHPSWTFETAAAQARELEAELRSARCADLLRDYYEQPASAAHQALRTLVHMRTCNAAGDECKFTGPPEEAPAGCLPWYDHISDEAWRGTVIFGHWAALGYRRTKRVLALDSGCAWGQDLTAVRLEDEQVTQVPLQDTVEGLTKE
ncbi:MAG: symmetrical bis(5'-nucleosyl)-tetraphosphatase [Planctomycetota bacterium]